MTTHKTDNDDGYALDLTGPVQHVATALGKAAPAALSIDDLADGYKHFSGDLARVRTHQNLDSDQEATVWLIHRAVDELIRNGKRGKVQLVVEDGWVSLAPGVTADDLKWRGRKVYAPPNIHEALGDPFNAMSGRFAGNVRKQTGKDDLSDLKMSLRALGWLPNHPAIKDARTGVTITGHRRLKAAAELRAEGVDVPDNIRYYNFEIDGEGDPADVKRMDEALGSNFGFRAPTPEERQETALWLSEKRDMTQQQIAATLGVSQQTVSRDLNKIVTQMGSELEPLIAQAAAGIQRGLTQSQVGVELGMANNSMTLAKAYSVALDRMRRAAEPEPLPVPEPLPAPEPLPDTPATRDVDEFLEDPSTGTTRDQVREAIREAEETMGDAEPVFDHVPGPTMETRPAVQPPPNLPPAPMRDPDGGVRLTAHTLAYYQGRAEELARRLDPEGRDREAVRQLRDVVADAWETADQAARTEMERHYEDYDAVSES